MSFTTSSDHFLNVSRGLVDGQEAGFIIGQNPSVPATSSVAVCDQGDFDYLTADTELFISSSSASDTAVTVIVQGLDDTFTRIVRSVTVSGQTQAALSGFMFRVHIAVVTGSVEPVGALYIAESDTLTAGVPDTAAKIKAVIPLTIDTMATIIDTGTEYASDNISHLGVFTVPAGFTMFVLANLGYTNKNDNVKLGGRVRPNGGVWFNRNPLPVYQSNVTINFEPPLLVPEKTDIEFRAVAGSADSHAGIQVFFILVENE